jgi:multiple sugar transport system permease protein
MNTPMVMEPTKSKAKNSEETFFQKNRYKIGQQITAYFFLLPALLVFALFAWYPIYRSIEMSFQNVNLSQGSTWIGFENYELMLRDPALTAILINSLQFAIWSLLLGYLVPVVIAILVREMRVGQGFFRIVYFLPTVVPAAVAVIIWRFLYDPDAGYLNQLLQFFNIPPQTWLQDFALAKPSLVAVMTWNGFGATALIYLASLQEFPNDLYEAAELDGASPLQRILNITLPQLFPVMTLMFVLQVIAVVQVFTEPFLLTKSGPGRETLTAATHIYNRAFIRLDMGYAAAWSVAMIVVLAGFSILVRILNDRLSRESGN